MSRPRKYPEELLERGVRLALESERPIAHVAADLGIHPETLRKRVRQAEADRGKRTDLLSSQEREEFFNILVTLEASELAKDFRGFVEAAFPVLESYGQTAPSQSFSSFWDYPGFSGTKREPNGKFWLVSGTQMR